MKKPKKILALVLAIATVAALAVGTFAFFTDRVQAKAEAKAGTLELALSQVTLSKSTGLKPGTGCKVDFTLSNLGNKSADVKEVLILRSPKVMNTTTPEFDLYMASDVTLDADGKATIKALEDMGKTDGAVIGIIGYPEPQSCIDRENGWFSVVNEYKDKYNLTIVNIGNYKGDADTAQQLMDGALVEYPDMAVIFTGGDPACIGALAAIKNAGATTKMIGFDANPEAHEAILDPENGKIWFADVAQDPYTIGHKIAEEMVKYLTDGTVDDSKILIAPYLVDASNAKAN